MGMCMCVCACLRVRLPRARVCVCVGACVHVCVLVRWSACTGVLAACAAAGPGELSAALAVACAQIAHQRLALPCLARHGSVCLQCVPQHTQPTRESRSSADAVGDAAGGPAGGPGGAAAATACAHHHGSHEDGRGSCRARVCARACACRWRGRSRRWPAGKAPRSPATQTRGRTRLCEVLGVLEVLKYTVRVSPAL